MLVPELADIEIVDRVEYQYLTVLIPSIENFALSKLFSSRPKDCPAPTRRDGPSPLPPWRR